MTAATRLDAALTNIVPLIEQRVLLSTAALLGAANRGNTCLELCAACAAKNGTAGWIDIVQPSLRADVRSSAGRTTKYGTINAAIVPISTAPPEPTGP
jgi:hypothetical protein